MNGSFSLSGKAILSTDILRRLVFIVATALFIHPMPGFTASCEILPYQNWCQGSNYWPIPNDWVADTNNDCQPEPRKYWYSDYDNSGNNNYLPCRAIGGDPVATAQARAACHDPPIWSDGGRTFVCEWTLNFLSTTHAKVGYRWGSTSSGDCSTWGDVDIHFGVVN
jgi:hypothetical protein